MRALLTVAFIASSAMAQIQYYNAYLDGAQEVPANASTGHGFGVVRYDAGTGVVDLFCYHEGLGAAPTAGHLHLGATGVNGGVIVGMTQTAPNTWTGTGVLSAPQAAALTTSGTYLNIHTAAFPGGEIRGQVVAPRSTRFTAVMSGAQEVPANGSTATGTAVAWLHEPDNRLVYSVQTSGLVSVTAGHFHQAPAGSNGGVVVGFTGSGTYFGVSQRLTTAQLTALMADGFYANVHTAAFPGGELRGQMIRDRGDHFTALLSGANEVPPTPSTGIGAAQVIVNPNGTLTLTGQFQLFGTTAVAAHVHRAAAGVNGSVVFGLSFAGGILSGTFTPTAADLVDLRAGNFYVNLHSSAFGGGEIRGQLLAATVPTFYGEGCTSTTGTRPHMGTTGVASMGSSFSWDLYGVPGSSLSLMFLSDQRSPGPFELPLLGFQAPGCFAFIPTILLQFTAFANPQGFASQGIAIPLDPALRNIPLYVQSVTLDAANAAGLVSSNAMTFSVL